MMCRHNFSALFNVPWVEKGWKSSLQSNGIDRNIQIMVMVTTTTTTTTTTIKKLFICRGKFDSGDSCPFQSKQFGSVLCMDIWYILTTKVRTADPMFSIRSNMITPTHCRWMKLTLEVIQSRSQKLWLLAHLRSDTEQISEALVSNSS
jgi:hypothetical protein